MDGLYVRRIDGPVTEGDKELFVISRPAYSWYKFRWMQLKEIVSRVRTRLSQYLHAGRKL